MLIDTHCHLDFEEFDLDREEVIKRARDSGVKYIINIGSSKEGSTRSLKLAEDYENIFATVGVHPHYASTVNEELIDFLKQKISESKKVVAIGEVGLDYFKNESPREEQIRTFQRFIGLSEELNLPLVIHSREAQSDTLSILKEVKSKKVVLHCFSQDEEYLKKYLDIGFFISFTCNLTYKNAHTLRSLLKQVPPERLMLETDAPFLPPGNFRGKRNEPAYIKYLCQTVSDIYKLSFEDVARITSLNAINFFDIKDENVKRGVIAYKIRDSLYLNITNICTDNCTFCVRNFSDFVKGHNLKLDYEPSSEEIIKAVGNPQQYREVVFCGYGEPFLRLDVILEVSRVLKQKGAYIRINTNGHGNLIHNRSVVRDLAGLVDEICISLNAEDPKKYFEICKPKFGPETFNRVKDFILECKAVIPRVSITCIDMPQIDIKRCEEIAKELGVGFRKRHLNIVG
ncbi:MAG: YchF/TatD family DNA exonuclease [Candidatus Omnitrophica bacterium]|nr:YchF/TatD family DNA exonuclease [Candidatus Omnitrophota bacterium]